MVRHGVLLEDVVDAVIALLSADAELQGMPLDGRISPDVDGDDYPCLIVTGVIGEVTQTLNSRHVWRDATIQITARDKGGTDKSNCVLIMRRVQILLDRVRIQEGGLNVGPFSEARQRPRAPDLVDGVYYPQIVLEYDAKAYRFDQTP